MHHPKFDSNNSITMTSRITHIHTRYKSVCCWFLCAQKITFYAAAEKKQKTNPNRSAYGGKCWYYVLLVIKNHRFVNYFSFAILTNTHSIQNMDPMDDYSNAQKWINIDDELFVRGRTNSVPIQI